MAGDTEGRVSRKVCLSALRGELRWDRVKAGSRLHTDASIKLPMTSLKISIKYGTVLYMLFAFQKNSC